MKLTVNGQERVLEVVDPDMPLLWAIRDLLGLKGTKFGCGQALCGACTVHLDGSQSARAKHLFQMSGTARSRRSKQSPGALRKPSSRLGSRTMCPNAATASRGRSCPLLHCSSPTRSPRVMMLTPR